MQLETSSWEDSWNQLQELPAGILLEAVPARSTLRGGTQHQSLQLKNLPFLPLEKVLPASNAVVSHIDRG